MTYCRQGHTLVDNEAEAQWDQLVPGTFFDLFVSATTFFGIVDEYTPPTANTLVCRLYTDPARTILHTAPIATGVPFSILNFIAYNWTPRDAELQAESNMGSYTSPPVAVRDDFGIWTGSWIASPLSNNTMQFNFDGAYTLFQATVDQPVAAGIAGVGLGAGTFDYCIVPVDGSGRLGAGSRKLSVTLVGPADIRLDWLPNNQVDSWNVYGRTSVGFGLLTNLPGGTVTFTDDGTLVPNPALQPALFEDPAWTVAAPNKQISITDGGIQLDGFGDEVSVEKRDDSTVLSDAVNVGTMNLTNAGETFDIDNLESSVNTTIDAVIDPNILNNQTGPVEDIPPIVITLDQHIFIDSDGNKRIVHIDDSNNRQTTSIIDTDTGLVTTIVLELDTQIELGRGDMTIEQALADLEVLSGSTDFPPVGSMSTKSTFSDFQELPDGTIIGNSTMELNTYDVTVTTPPSGGTNGLIVWSPPDSVPADTPRMLRSVDGGQTYIDDFDPRTRFTLPAGPNWRLHSTGGYFGAGEGWFVMTAFQTSPQDIAFFWTNDITAGVWPFQDGSGRGISIPAALDWIFGYNDAHNNIVTMASGKVVNYISGSNASNGNKDNQQWFFPASGVFTTFPVVEGQSKKTFANELWPAANKYMWVVDTIAGNFEGQTLYTADFGPSEVAPLSNIVNHGLLDPDEISGFHSQSVRFVTSPQRAILIWIKPNFPATAVHRAWFSDDAGATWQVHPEEPVTGNEDTEPLWTRMTTGKHISYNAFLNKFIVRAPSVASPGDQVTWISDPDDGFNWTEIGSTGLQNSFWQHKGVGHWRRLASLHIEEQNGWPLLWDGTRFISTGPDIGGDEDWESFKHADANLIDSGFNFNLPAPVTHPYDAEASYIAAEVGSAGGVPESTIFANIRPYIPFRFPAIPSDDIPNMPAPFRQRGSSWGGYDSRHTYDFRTPDGFTINVTVTSFQRGGTGNTTQNRIEDGKHIVEDISYNRTANLPPKAPTKQVWGIPTPDPFA